MRLVFVRDPQEWRAQIWPWLSKISDGSSGRFTAETLWSRIERKVYWLALVLDDDVKAVLVGEPVTWETGLREFWIVGLVGIGAKDWLHLDTELRRALKEAGFWAIATLARPGWSRLMKSRGYRMTHVQMDARL